MSLVMNAQFVITPNGTLMSEDTNKDYIIKEMQGSKEQLFNKIKKNLYLKYLIRIRVFQKSAMK